MIIDDEKPTSRVDKLAQRLLDDRARQNERSPPRIGGCFLCGRSYSPQLSSDDDSARFCSDKCRQAYDAGAMPTIELNPFTVERWRIIAGPLPGYMPKAPLRLGRHGVFVNCLQCRREFESKGLRCCSTECERAYNGRVAAAATIAEVGDVLTEKRKCECCGGPIPNWVGEGVKRRRTRKSQRYCSVKCQRKANKNGSVFASSPPETGGRAIRPSAPLFGPSTPPLNLVGGYRFPNAPVRCVVTAEEP